jgi:hypothetical protein
VTGWTSPTFNIACSPQAFWARGGAWSPDDSTVYVATTGYKEPGVSGSGPRPAGSPCDVAMAFPATQASVSPKWINQTGCDSLYTAAADSHAAYFGGHERWSMNPNACDALGPGGYNAPGTEGLTRLAGRYTSTQRVPRDTTAGPVAWAPMTCYLPAPGYGSPATTWMAATPAAA